MSKAYNPNWYGRPNRPSNLRLAAGVCNGSITTNMDRFILGGLEGVGPVPGGVKTDPPGGFFWELQGGSMCLPGGVEPSNPPNPPGNFTPARGG